MQIILFQPQIPQNTGNIVRTCAVTGASLKLVTPLGFSIQDRWLKRAGLDYWEGVNVETLDDLEKFLSETPFPFTLFSSKAEKYFHEVTYSPDHLLCFGSETSGLPESFHARWKDKMAKIPMRKGARCLNLATSVGIALYEAQRQQNFKDMLQ